jgi:hypothetical protein
LLHEADADIRRASLRWRPDSSGKAIHPFDPQFVRAYPSGWRTFRGPPGARCLRFFGHKRWIARLNVCACPSERAAAEPRQNASSQRSQRECEGAAILNCWASQSRDPAAPSRTSSVSPLLPLHAAAALTSKGAGLPQPAHASSDRRSDHRLIGLAASVERRAPPSCAQCEIRPH